MTRNEIESIDGGFGLNKNVGTAFLETSKTETKGLVDGGIIVIRMVRC